MAKTDECFMRGAQITGRFANVSPGNNEQPRSGRSINIVKYERAGSLTFPSLIVLQDGENIHDVFKQFVLMFLKRVRDVIG